MLGKIEGMRRRGQQRTRWLDDIIWIFALCTLWKCEALWRFCGVYSIFADGQKFHHNSAIWLPVESRKKKKKDNKLPLEVSTFLSQTDHMAIQEGSLTLEKGGVHSLKSTYVIFNPSLPLFFPRSSFTPGTHTPEGKWQGTHMLKYFHLRNQFLDLKPSHVSFSALSHSGTSLCHPHGLYVPCQAPLSTEFSRQEYWSRLPFPCLEVL